MRDLWDCICARSSAAVYTIHIHPGLKLGQTRNWHLSIFFSYMEQTSHAYIGTNADDETAACRASEGARFYGEVIPCLLNSAWT